MVLFTTPDQVAKANAGVEILVVDDTWFVVGSLGVRGGLYEVWVKVDEAFISGANEVVRHVGAASNSPHKHWERHAG